MGIPHIFKKVYSLYELSVSTIARQHFFPSLEVNSIRSTIKWSLVMDKELCLLLPV